MLKAIAFDLDDTLFPERAYVMSGFRVVAQWVEEHLGIKAEDGYTQLKYLFEQGRRGDTFDEWLKYYGYSNDHLISTLVKIYRHHDPQLQPYHEVPALLKKLRLRFRLGLVSDGYLITQKKKYAALGLDTFFDAIVFSDQWGRDCWKPNPRPFQEVLQRLAVKGHEAVYVGDNPFKDFWGARRLGLWTIRCRRQDGIYSKYAPPSLEHTPHLEILDLAHLDDALKRLPVEEDATNDQY